MKQTYFLQYNIPPENNFIGEADYFINVIIEWKGSFYSTDGRPIVFVMPIINNAILRTVKNWSDALDDMEKIGEKYFAEIAKQERIKQAKAELAAAGEFDNPVLERYDGNIHPFFNEILSNHFTPVS